MYIYIYVLYVYVGCICIYIYTYVGDIEYIVYRAYININAYMWGVHILTGLFGSAHSSDYQ